MFTRNESRFSNVSPLAREIAHEVERNNKLIFRASIFACVASLIAMAASAVFAGWVIVKLMQYFGVIQ